MSTPPARASRRTRPAAGFRFGGRRSGGGRGDRPPPFQVRFTREGKAFLLFTVGVGLAAVNTGNNLLYLMLSLMLSLLVLNGMLSEWVMRGLAVERSLPVRLFASTPALVELTLRNRKRRLSSYSLEVEDVAVGAAAERRCYFLKVPPSGAQTARYARSPERRGPLTFQGFRVRTRYPFGLLERIRFFPGEAEVLVYPRLGRDGRQGAVDHQRGRHGSPGAPVGAGPEIAGLREYRDGDEARSIHWRRTAALGRLVVRERHAESEAHLALRLDARRPAAAGEAWERRFEEAVAQAAGLVDRSLRRGRSAEILVEGVGPSPKLPPGAPPDPILRFLALLAPVDVHGNAAAADGDDLGASPSADASPRAGGEAGPLPASAGQAAE